MSRRFDLPADELFEAMLTAVAEQLEIRGRSVNSAEIAEAISFHDVTFRLLHNLGRAGAQESMNPKERLEDEAAFLGAFWRLVTLGFAVPCSDNAFLAGRSGLIVTARGKTVLQADDDNPFAPSYLRKLRTSHAMCGTEEGRDVIDRLEDAWACLDAHLYRPAIVMMGVASEVSANLACDLLQLGGRNAAARMDLLVAHVDGLPDRQSAQAERKRVLKAAVDSMSLLRGLRNDAAHGRNFTIGRYDAHERYGSAARRLPKFWELLIIPNQQQAPPTP